MEVIEIGILGVKRAGILSWGLFGRLFESTFRR